MDQEEYEIFSYVSCLSSIEKPEKYDITYMKKYLEEVYRLIEKDIYDLEFIEYLLVY